MLTHRFDPFCLDAFDKLRAEGPASWDYFLASEITPGPPPDVGARPHYRFHFSDLLARGYLPVKPSITPGSVHFGLFHFALGRPDFERVWQVEYDVHFNGHWRDFFVAQDPRADLLTCHVRAQVDEPQWHWWSTFGHRDGLPCPPRLRAFHPIFRLSRRAIRYLDACFRGGWHGHCEATIPSLLHDVLMGIEEIGGAGAFTRSENVDRFYPASPPSSAGALTGTMRWRPECSPPFTRPNTLYHPVKRSFGP